MAGFHGSAIAIVIGLVLAYVGGLVTGGLSHAEMLFAARAQCSLWDADGGANFG